MPPESATHVAPVAAALADGMSAPAAAVATLTHTGALMALASEWWALWDRCPGATPFQSPGWALAWWRQFGAGGLWTVTVREPGGRLVGIAPLYLHACDGLHTVRLVGAGLSDYLDLLAEPGWETTLVRGVADELAAHPERWDRAEFQQLAAGSPLLQAGAAFSGETAAAEPCPVVSLAANARGETAAASARLCANIAADARRLRRVAIGTCIEPATTETLGAMLHELRRLHGARWERRGQRGVLSDASVWDFHCEAASALFARGVARLYALRANGGTIGVYYGFVSGGRAYYYLGGFDPAYRQAGIGNQLVAHAMAQGRGEGAAVFDFLRGQEPYKYRWGAKDVPTFNRHWYRDPVLRYGNPELFHVRAGNIPSRAQSVA